ncbi:hypothetical protein RYX36_034389 [Vicia faba]
MSSSGKVVRHGRKKQVGLKVDKVSIDAVAVPVEVDSRVGLEGKKRFKLAFPTLEEALNSGFEDFKRIRTDPNLANARASPEFDPLFKRFDESFINENAINAIKSILGIFIKK